MFRKVNLTIHINQRCGYTACFFAECTGHGRIWQCKWCRLHTNGRGQKWSQSLQSVISIGHSFHQLLLVDLNKIAFLFRIILLNNSFVFWIEKVFQPLPFVQLFPRCHTFDKIVFQDSCFGHAVPLSILQCQQTAIKAEPIRNFATFFIAYAFISLCLSRSWCKGSGLAINAEFKCNTVVAYFE